jgi:xanthine/CO dehydrogenase XdhC/CoxF family maturation factor
MYSSQRGEASKTAINPIACACSLIMRSRASSDVWPMRSRGRWHNFRVTTTSLHRLIGLYERARAADTATVLATVIRTAGSTYAKAGAHMLIAADGEYAGLLSGGCLEGDLAEHAARVRASGAAHIVRYDMRTPDDQLFGLGAGCEGAMDVLLQRVGPAEHWQPLAAMIESFQTGARMTTALVTASQSQAIALGAAFWNGPQAATRLPPTEIAALLAMDSPNTRLVELAALNCEVLLLPHELPPKLLIAGAGPDTRPLSHLAAFLGWRITLADHRAAYLQQKFFPPEAQLIETRAAAITEQLALDTFDAAVVMSHHLQSDLEYLRALAGSTVRYVGLLGPTARRDKLLADLGELSTRLTGRLRAPIGLDIGGRAPESIALSIVSEIHASLAGREGRAFSQTARTARPTAP